MHGQPAESSGKLDQVFLTCPPVHLLPNAALAEHEQQIFQWQHLKGLGSVSLSIFLLTSKDCQDFEVSLSIFF